LSPPGRDEATKGAKGSSMDMRGSGSSRAALLMSLAFPLACFAGEPPPATGDLIRPPTEALGRLLGPLTPPGSPAGVPETAVYDKTLLARGREFADAFPGKPDKDLNGDGAIDVGDTLFYDLPLVLYRIYYRTGDTTWRDKARAAAKAWRDHPGNRKMAPYLAGDWKLWKELVNQPRCMGTVGLAVFALEADDADARKVVDSHAKLVENTWMHGPYQSLADPVMPLGDPRECGYALMALTASTVCGDDHREAARELLDRIVARQKPDGQWLAKDEKVEGGGYTSNFMTGLLNEALTFYDRALGDARILPAVEKNLAWTWKTQWSEAGKGFQYHSVGETQVEGVLGGLMIQAWGYAYAKTGRPEYLDQGQRILGALTDRGFKEIWGVKQYSQMFRSSPLFLGYVAERAGKRS
jgi:hypothetical protein